MDTSSPFDPAGSRDALKVAPDDPKFLQISVRRILCDHHARRRAPRDHRAPRSSGRRPDRSRYGHQLCGARRVGGHQHRCNHHHRGCRREPRLRHQRVPAGPGRCRLPRQRCGGHPGPGRPDRCLQRCRRTRSCDIRCRRTGRHHPGAGRVRERHPRDHRHPDTRCRREPRRRLRAPVERHAGDGDRQRGVADRTSQPVQRVLAGEELCDARCPYRLHRNRACARIDHGHHRRHGPGSSPRPHRCRHLGHQRHQPAHLSAAPRRTDDD